MKELVLSHFRWFSFVLLCAAFSFVGAAHAYSGNLEVQIDPEHHHYDQEARTFDFDFAPGASYEDTITVVNYSPREELILHLDVKPSQGESDAAFVDWFHLPEEVRIAPHSVQDIPVEVQFPRGSFSQFDYRAVLLMSFETEGGQVTQHHQMGLKYDMHIEDSWRHAVTRMGSPFAASTLGNYGGSVPQNFYLQMLLALVACVLLSWVLFFREGGRLDSKVSMFTSLAMMALFAFVIPRPYIGANLLDVPVEAEPVVEEVALEEIELVEELTEEPEKIEMPEAESLDSFTDFALDELTVIEETEEEEPVEELAVEVAEIEELVVEEEPVEEVIEEAVEEPIQEVVEEVAEVAEEEVIEEEPSAEEVIVLEPEELEPAEPEPVVEEAVEPEVVEEVFVEDTIEELHDESGVVVERFDPEDLQFSEFLFSDFTEESVTLASIEFTNRDRMVGAELSEFELRVNEEEVRMQGSLAPFDFRTVPVDLQLGEENVLITLQHQGSILDTVLYDPEELYIVPEPEVEELEEPGEPSLERKQDLEPGDVDVDRLNEDGVSLHFTQLPWTESLSRFYEKPDEDLLEHVDLTVLMKKGDWAYVPHASGGEKNSAGNEVPSADFEISAAVNVDGGLYVYLSAEASEDEDDRDLSYEWTFQDHQYPGSREIQYGEQVEILLSNPGEAFFKLKVRDPHGAYDSLQVNYALSQSYEFEKKSVFELATGEGAMQGNKGGKSERVYVSFSNESIVFPETAVSIAAQEVSASLNELTVSPTAPKDLVGEIAITATPPAGVSIDMSEAVLLIGENELPVTVSADGQTATFSLSNYLKKSITRLDRSFTPELFLSIPGGAPPGQYVFDVTYTFY